MTAVIARSRAEIDLSGTIAALQDWADWTRAYTGAERIGHANHCVVSCSSAGKNWQDFEDSVNRFRNDCVEVVVDDLSPAQKCAINHQYLDAVFRFPRGNFDELLLDAHIRVRQELIRKGVVV